MSHRSSLDEVSFLKGNWGIHTQLCGKWQYCERNMNKWDVRKRSLSFSSQLGGSLRRTFKWGLRVKVREQWGNCKTTYIKIDSKQKPRDVSTKDGAWGHKHELFNCTTGIKGKTRGQYWKDVLARGRLEV